MDRLLNDSPWAMQTGATMDDPSDREEPALPAPPTGLGQPNPGGRSTSGPTQARWDGGIGKNRRGHLATIPVMVRWDSAAIVRQALEKKQDPDLSILNAAASANFVITVVGLLPANQSAAPASLQAKSSSKDENAPARTTEEILEWFMTNSRLAVKGETDMQPQNVKFDAASGTLHLLFKRNDALLARKRDIVFLTRFGSMHVQTRFRVKDMVVDGHPDL